MVVSDPKVRQLGTEMMALMTADDTSEHAEVPSVVEHVRISDTIRGLN